MKETVIGWSGKACFFNIGTTIRASDDVAEVRWAPFPPDDYTVAVRYSGMMVGSSEPARPFCRR